MIGIPAGMGPKSTAPFVDKVVQLCQEMYAAKHDVDFPPMMIYSCPTPFYLDRPLDHQALESSIISGAQKLAATGVDFIVIPCNTAHRYFDNIRNSVDVPVLNIVEESIKCISANTVPICHNHQGNKSNRKAFYLKPRSFDYRLSPSVSILYGFHAI